MVIKFFLEFFVKKDVVIFYFKECFGDEIMFYYEEIKKIDGGCFEFLKENIREVGEKIEVFIFMEGVCIDMILVECLVEF